MNFSFLLLPSVLQIDEKSASRQIRNPHVSHKTEVVVSHPLQDVEIPSCPFCNIERCSPLDFCYVIKNRLYGSTTGEYCGSLSDLTTIIRDRLANHITDNACQPAVTDLSIAYCWCQNTSARETMESQLRRVRIWRYASLKWHADREAMASGEGRFYTLALTSLLLLLFF